MWISDFQIWECSDQELLLQSFSHDHHCKHESFQLFHPQAIETLNLYLAKTKRSSRKPQ